MSVRVEGNIIHLEGRCLVEDAEPLLLALQDIPGAIVALDGATRLHLAVVQILLASRPVITGTPRDAVIATHLLAALMQINPAATDLGLGT